MRYCKISKENSPLYFGFDVFCQFKARVPEFDAMSSVQCTLSSPQLLGVGCPRNNQICFSLRTETNRNSICFGCFSVCFTNPKNIFLGLFRCFGPVLKQPKQTEFSWNKPKKSPKNFLYLAVLETVNFFSRFKPKQTKTQSVSIVFLFPFCETKKFFCGLFRCFGPVSKQPKETDLMVWGIKKVDISTNLVLFRLVFCLFRFFRNTETPCFDINATQPKQTSSFG